MSVIILVLVVGFAVFVFILWVLCGVFFGLTIWCICTWGREKWSQMFLLVVHSHVLAFINVMAFSCRIYFFNDDDNDDRKTSRGCHQGIFSNFFPILTVFPIIPTISPPYE